MEKIIPKQTTCVNLDDVWQSIEITPREDTRVIAIFKTGYAVCWTVTDIADWNIKCQIYQVYKWAYVNALLPHSIKQHIHKYLKQ